MNLQPLADRVVVRSIEAEQVTASGIVLPDTAAEKPQGQGPRRGAGPLRGRQAHPAAGRGGDEVIYSAYGGTEVKVDGEDLLILRESDILAKAV